MNKLFQVMLLSIVVTVGFAGCSKKAEEAAAASADKAKEAVKEMKSTTIDAAKEAAAKKEDGDAKEVAVDALQAAKDATAKK
jgi:hypothetical protein